MPFNQSLTKAVDEIIYSFVQQVADKHNLDPNELITMWNGEPSGKTNSSVTTIPSTDDMDNQDVWKLKKPELQELCRKKGVKCSGTKEQLISYLLGKDSSSPKKSSSNKKKTESKVMGETTPVAKKLTAKVPTVAIRRNQFGNHEHPETSLVFDKKTKKVIGKQNDDGTVDDLTKADIDICNQYKFEYAIPDNLEKKTKLDDEKVEGLEEEFEDEEEEEIVDSEEEVVEEELIEDDEEEDFEEEFEDEEFEDFE
jgi:hypothetical protein